MDRRGFGASPDGPGYSAEREFSDVAMVVDAVGARTGESVVLFGHSWGARCALWPPRGCRRCERSSSTSPASASSPPGSLDRIEERLAAGDYEGAVIEVLESAGMTEDEIAERRAAPNWPDRVATAPTIAREGRIEEGWDWQPAQFAGLGARTLFLTGSETTAELAEATSFIAAAIPGSRVHVFAGHGHVAHRSDPAAVADVVKDWLPDSAERWRRVLQCLVPTAQW